MVAASASFQVTPSSDTMSLKSLARCTANRDPPALFTAMRSLVTILVVRSANWNLAHAPEFSAMTLASGLMMS